MTQISSTAFSTAAPLTFARGRGGDVYAVNGQGRGLRWDTVSNTVEQLGITAPASKPTLTASTTSPKYYIAGVDVLDGGYGYQKVPTVTFSGGAGSGAEAKAVLLNGSVHRVIMQDYGTAYTSAPTVSVGEPDGTPGGTGATFTVTASGRIADVLPTSRGSGYQTAPAVTVSGGGGSGALLTAGIDDSGQVVSVAILNAGSGYTSAPTITFSTPSGGSAATGTAVLAYTVTSVTVTDGGTGYSGTPRLEFTAPSGGSGAYAECTVGTGLDAGKITAATVRAGGSYASAPTAAVSRSIALTPRAASLSAVAKPAIKGKYWAAIRYIDDTMAANNGPTPSSITPLAEIEITDPAGSITWTWSNAGMEDRVSQIELWRTTADQALVLYRVAVVSRSTTTYVDTLGDSQLIDASRPTNVTGAAFGALPIVLPNGQPNARRFQPPPTNKSVVVMFQDRAWYAVDTSGNEPNSLYFSEVDEPESVPDTNEIVLQQNVRSADSITALMPFGSSMVVFQNRHAYRFAYAAQPVIDSSVILLAQRGCLNQRCWDMHDGVAYVVDSMGMYVFDGNTATPISDAVDQFWTEGIIHFPSAKWFMVRVDPVSRIVRFFHSVSAGFPDRALCFHPVTKAWWVEVYAQTFSAATGVQSGGRQRLLAGGQGGGLYMLDSGSQDIDASAAATGIQCQYRTGNMPFDPKDPSRTIRVLYKPTTNDCNLSLALHYNNSSTPRSSAIATDRGTGFRTEGNAAAALNLKTTRSSLGDATGYAACSYAGRVDDRSSGADRHLSVAVSATRTAGDDLLLHGIAIDGVAQ